MTKNLNLYPEVYGAETFESPYAGAGSLFSIGQNTGLEGFTTSELTTSSAIHGDFDEASLNYSGHQNFEVRAEMMRSMNGEDYITWNIFLSIYFEDNYGNESLKLKENFTMKWIFLTTVGDFVL